MPWSPWMGESGVITWMYLCRGAHGWAGTAFMGTVYSMLRPLIHMLLHFAMPAAVAKFAYPRIFLRAWLIMMLAMLIDFDHLLADPIYDPGRCSIGFHPLHQYPVIAVYALAAVWPKTRLIGIGLLIHVFLDGIDCLWMQYEI